MTISNYTVGLKVSHQEFGKGVIRRLEGDGESQKAIIWFDKVGPKKLLLRFAGLIETREPATTDTATQIQTLQTSDMPESPTIIELEVPSGNILIESESPNNEAPNSPASITNSAPAKLKFNQTEKITARLRDLVRNYPKGLGLIKEFLQNADDSGASYLVMTYDRRNHLGEFKDFPAMSVALGPALLFANDQEFTEEDFERIQQIGEGGKLKEVARTGRFGQGFNTCYSVSDHPSLMTSDRIAWFDPHHHVFNDGSNASAWKLADAISYWPDWLNTFKPGGWSAGSTAYPGTIFRLPIRLHEKAEHSEILKEEFSDHDFQEILDELHQTGAALLVFLRSVTRLEIREIGVDGKYVTRFKIDTSNVSMVDQNRSKFRSIVSGSPKALLESMISTKADLPLVKYDHSFSILDLNGNQRFEHWSIVNGLFRGPEDILLHKALEVWQHDEKAIPWAGAAVCRTSRSDAKLGGLACFLPLPEQTKWQVWLHGWFDLSSNRKGITRSGDVGETTRIRFSWNKLLMEHAVGKAWALLVSYIKGNPGENNAPYEFWLKPQDKPDEVDQALALGFYSSIIPQSVIRSRSQEEYVWQTFSQLRADLPSKWANKLLEPLSVEGWSVADPHLPDFVRDGLKRVTKVSKVLEPKLLRYELRIPEANPDIECEVSSAPRAMLSRREWIYSIADFCADGDWDNLQQLLLAILSDGLLHTYNACGNVYLADSEERELLSALPERFLDLEYLEAIKIDSPAEKIDLFQFDVKALIEFTPHQLSRCNPETHWWINFFDYLTSAEVDQVEAVRDNLTSIPLIPDQNRILSEMGLVETPLIPGSIPKNLKDALDKLGIPILTVAKDLESAISRFASKHSGFVWNLTPDDIAYNLKSHVEEACLNEDALDDRSCLEPILNFLCSSTWIKENDDRLPLLRQLRLFPTTCNQRVAADYPDVYIPGGFSPPVGIEGKYRLLDLGAGNIWLSLYKSFGIKTLDGITFVEKVLLPSFVGSDRKQCKDLLVWLRDEFRLVERELDEDKRKQLRDKIRQTAIIPVEDGSLQPPRLVYSPESLEALELLQEFARVPDKEFFSSDNDLWKEFFEELSLPIKPLARDIYLKIKALTEEAKSSKTTVVKAHLRILRDHLQERWKSLSEIKVEGQQTLSEVLSKLSWLTASSDGGTIYAACKIWPDQLWKANELVPARHANLVASKYPILEGLELGSDMAESLKLITNIKLEEAIEHFSSVLTHPLSDEKNIDAVNRAAEAFYRFIGQLDSSIAILIKTFIKSIADKNCIFVSGRWWHPDRCFFEQLQFHTRWAASLANSDLRLNESAIHKGIELLGVRKQLENSDLIEMLADYADQFDGLPLPQSELLQVRHAIRLLRSETNSWLRSHDIFVPLIDGRIENARLALVPDDPRLSNYSGALPIIENNDDAYDVGLRAGAKSLRGALVDRLKVSPIPTRDYRLLELSAKLDNNLKSKYFYYCLQRIAYEEALRSRDSDIAPLQAAFADELKQPQHLSVIICSSIEVQTVVTIEGTEFILFDCESSSFLDTAVPRLWLKEGKTRRLKDELVRAICHICNLSDQLRISRILDVAPELMSGVLDEEEVATIPEGQCIDLIEDVEDPSDINVSPLNEGESLSETDDIFDSDDRSETVLIEEEVDDEVLELSDAYEVSDDLQDDTIEANNPSSDEASHISETGTLLTGDTQIVDPPIKPGHGRSMPWKEPNEDSPVDGKRNNTEPITPKEHTNGMCQ